MLLPGKLDRWRFFLFIGPLWFGFLASAPSDFAADANWIGSSGTTWSNSLNWDTVTTVPGSADNARFSGAFINQPSLGASAATVGGIWMTTGVLQNVTIGGTATLTLAGNTINSTAGLGILVNNSSAFTLTINCPVALGATQTWTNNSSNVLTIGAVNLSTFSLTVNGSGSTSINGVVSGSGSITKSGTGTLTLSGTNSFTGSTTVNAGTLDVTGSISTSAVTVNNSGTVIGGTGTIGGSVSIGSGAILRAGSGSTGQTLTMQGAVTMGSGSIVQMALGASGAHSTLALSGPGTISFQSAQIFNITDLGVTAGSTYTGIITGIGSDPGTESGWTINNQSWSYNFSYDSSNGGEINLTVTALPEPSTYVAGALALIVLIYQQRERFKLWRSC